MTVRQNKALRQWWRRDQVLLWMTSVIRWSSHVATKWEQNRNQRVSRPSPSSCSRTAAAEEGRGTGVGGCGGVVRARQAVRQVGVPKSGWSRSVKSNLPRFFSSFSTEGKDGGGGGVTKTNRFNLGLIEPIGSKGGEELNDMNVLVCSKHSTHGCRLFINNGLISNLHSCVQLSAKCELWKFIITD